MKYGVIVLLTLMMTQFAWAKPHSHTEQKTTSDAKLLHQQDGQHNSNKSQGHHHRFANPAQWEKKWEGAKRDQEQQPLKVIKYCDIQAGMTVVDLGAGTGYFTRYLSDQVKQQGKVLALDIEPKMVAWLKAKTQKQHWTNVDVKLVQADDPQLKESSIDRILIVNVWHHIDARPLYLNKLKRALRDNGVLCIVEIKKDAPYGPPIKFRLTEDELQSELRKGGMGQFETMNLSTQYVLKSVKLSH